MRRGKQYKITASWASFHLQCSLNISSGKSTKNNVYVIKLYVFVFYVCCCEALCITIYSSIFVVALKSKFYKHSYQFYHSFVKKMFFKYTFLTIKYYSILASIINITHY